jgi:hypothetical protein
MARAVLILANAGVRARAHRWVDAAPVNTSLEFKAPKRTLPQNDHMWELLTNIAWQVSWNGERLSTDDWKLLFMDALTREVRLVKSLDGLGFVALRRSSDLSREEMSDLIEIILEWCARHDIDPYAKEPKGGQNADPK